MDTSTHFAGVGSEPEPLAITVIVPLFNEEKTLPVLLSSLAIQTAQPEEVVFVDAGSTDRTREILETFRSPFSMHILCRGRLNPGEARNEGIGYASAEWVAFADGGTELAPDWLSALASRARTSGADIVFGTYNPACDTFFRRCAALAYVPGIEKNGIRGPFVGSMALRRSLLEVLGGFPRHRAAEDLVFFERLAASGERITYAPEAVVEWQTAGTAVATFKRFCTYSEANLRAGRGRFWHLGLARQYAVVGSTTCVLVAMGHPKLAGVAVFAWLAARALRAAVAKRHSFPFETLNPVILAGAASLLAVIDAATISGAVRWAWKSIRWHSPSHRE